MSFILVLGILSIDRITKIIAAKVLVLNRPVPLIKGFLYFTLVNNRGAAFGILKNQVPFFILTSLVAIVLIYFQMRKHKSFSLYQVSLSLILAGAVGNLIDRVFLGYVVDFIDFRIWPVFNVADSSITIGAVLLAYSILSQKEKVKSTFAF